MALLNFPNTRLNGDPLQNGDEYTGDNGVTYIYNNGKWVGHSPVLVAGTNSLINNGYVVQVDVNGNLVLEPGKDVRDSNGNILIVGSTTSSTRWDLGVNDISCPIFTELTTSSFIASTGRTHLELYQTGDWSIGSRTYNRYINSSDDGRGIAMTTNRGTILFGNTPEQCEPPTASTHFHIMRDDPANVDLFFGDDFDYVKLPSISNGNGVEIGTSGGSTWRFDTDGLLTFPGEQLIIQPISNNPIGNVISSLDANLLTFSAGTSTYAQFGWLDTFGGLPTNLSGIRSDATGLRIETGTPILHYGVDEIDIRGSTAWQFDSTGTLTLPEANKITAYVPTSGYVLTGLATFEIDQGDFTYRWSAYDTNIQELLFGAHAVGPGWVFYPIGQPEAAVTVIYSSANLVPPAYLQITFSDQLGEGPYVVLSPDYVAERNGPIVIGGKNETNWTFGTDTTLTIPGDIQDANGSVIRVASTSTAPFRVNGQLWFNAEDGRAYIKYENNWIDLNPPLVPPVSTYLDGLVVDGTTISTLDSTETMYIGGDLLPEYNNMYDLGSAERQWKSLYVSTSTIYIGGTPLSVDSAGNLLVDGSPIIAAANAGDRITSGTSSVIVYEDGTTTLPGDIIVGDNDGHIYIDDALTGATSIRWVNTTPNSTLFRVYTDDRNSLNNQQLEMGFGTDAGFYINTTENVDGLYNNPDDDHSWTFGKDGNITFPDGSVQTTAYTGGNNNVWLDYIQVDQNVNPGYYTVGVSSVQHDSQSNIITVMNNWGPGADTPSLSKFDPQGEVVWTKYYTTSTSIDGWGVAVDSQDDIYVAGAQNSGMDGVWLEKLSGVDGTPLWGKSLDGFEGYVVDVGSDNCPVIVGVDWKGSKDLFVTKFSSTGTLLWTHDLGDASYDDYAWGMAIGPDNEVITVGTTTFSSNNSGSDALLVAKYDVSGTLQWQREIFDDNWYGWNADGADAVVDHDGNIYVLFNQSRDGDSSLFVILFKITPDGETIPWNSTLTATGPCTQNWGGALDIDSSGNIYLNSGVISYSGGPEFFSRTFVSSFNSSGECLWQRELLRNAAGLSAGQINVEWPGSSSGSYYGGNHPKTGSSISVKAGKVVISGGGIIADTNLFPSDPYLYDTAFGYLFQTTTSGELFSQGEWSLVAADWAVGSTLLNNNPGACDTDGYTVQVNGDISPDYGNNIGDIVLQRFTQGNGTNFKYSHIQEGINTAGPDSYGVTSITGNHDLNVGVGLTSEHWAQLMWVPDTSAVTIADIDNGAAVYNWAYAGSDGFQITNAITGTDYTWTFDTNGILNLPNNNYLETIDSNLSIGSQGTATIRSNAETLEGTKSWIFGADGSLTVPGSILSNIDFIVESNVDGYNSGLYFNANTATGSASILYGTQDIIIRASNNSLPLKDWVFSSTGTLILPATGDIVRNGVSVLDGLGSGFATTSTLINGGYTVSLGSTGALTLPDGGTLRMSTAPTSSIGASGDKAGTIAVNTASIFYCIADYVLDTGTYSVLTTNINNGSIFFIEIAKGTYPQPQVGWGVSVGGTITQIDDTTTDLGTSWRISVSAVTAYSIGTTVTLTNPSPSQPNIWVKQAWGTTGSW